MNQSSCLSTRWNQSSCTDPGSPYADDDDAEIPQETDDFETSLVGSADDDTPVDILVKVCDDLDGIPSPLAGGVLVRYACRRERVAAAGGGGLWFTVKFVSR